VHRVVTPAELFLVEAKTWSSAEVQASDTPDGEVSIDLIYVEPGQRGHGAARAVLEGASVWADRNAVVLVLKATSALGADIARLVEFYRGYGFIPNGVTADGEVKMRRVWAR